MKPVCVPCRRFFRVKKTGYYFIEGMPNNNHALPGNVDAASWSPYRVWSGDLWECEGCNTQIVSGTGRSSISEHYEPNFKELVAALGADQLQVNDC